MSPKKFVRWIVWIQFYVYFTGECCIWIKLNCWHSRTHKTIFLSLNGQIIYVPCVTISVTIPKPMCVHKNLNEFSRQSFVSLSFFFNDTLLFHLHHIFNHMTWSIFLFYLTFSRAFVWMNPTVILFSLLLLSSCLFLFVYFGRAIEAHKLTRNHPLKLKKLNAWNVEIFSVAWKKK